MMEKDASQYLKDLEAFHSEQAGSVALGADSPSSILFLDECIRRNAM